jgi:hypothetical protein
MVSVDTNDTQGISITEDELRKLLFHNIGVVIPYTHYNEDKIQDICFSLGIDWLYSNKKCTDRIRLSDRLSDIACFYIGVTVVNGVYCIHSIASLSDFQKEKTITVISEITETAKANGDVNKLPNYTMSKEVSGKLTYLFELISQLPSSIMLNKHIIFDLRIHPIGINILDISYDLSQYDASVPDGINKETTSHGLFWNNPLDNNESCDDLIWGRVNLNTNTVDDIRDVIVRISDTLDKLEKANWDIKKLSEV